jgi:magnesium-transporting ATPase (P-type)
MSEEPIESRKETQITTEDNQITESLNEPIEEDKDNFIKKEDIKTEEFNKEDIKVIKNEKEEVKKDKKNEIEIEKEEISTSKKPEKNSSQLINNQNYFNKSNSSYYKKNSKDNLYEYVSEKLSESNDPIENPDKRLSINQDNSKLSNYFDLDLSFYNNKKQKRFHEFFINDNQKNFKLKHPNNKLSTTKYNIFTFFPKSLIIQFVRLSNVYFLTTAIIQSIPIISPLSSYTAIVPLIFVLSVSIIREFIEDLSRLKYDNMNNNEEVYVFRNGEFIKSISETIKVGEIILIKEGENVPCDIILIDSNLNDGLCYVETSNLDGEKNLKNKLCNILTYGLFCEKKHVKFEKIFTTNKIIKNNILISGFVQCD